MSSKRLFFNHQLMKACLAAVFAFGLAACSSSSDQQTTAPTDPPPTAEAEQTAITNAIAAAKTAVDGLTAESSDADVAAAQAAITAAHNAIAGAEQASAADTVANIAKLDAIRTSFATAQTAIEEHRAELAVQRQAAIDAKTKEIGTKLEAMNAEARGDGGRGLPEHSSRTISRDRDGTTVTVTDGMGTPAEDDDVTYVHDMDLGDGTSRHVREADADENGNVVTQIAVITTDIEAPTATAFGDVYSLNVRVDGETPSTTSPADALNVAEANLGHVKAGAFVAPVGTTGVNVLSFQHAVADDPSTPEDESVAAAEIAGTYEGAMGIYKCNAAAACTVSVDGEGTVSAVSNDNDWIFIPADGATVDVADTAYLDYGFWLQKTTDADGVVTYNGVETLARATGHGNSTGTVTGSASYTGGATGVYVRHVYSEGGGKIASSTAGHFTAEASLKAYFGQPAAPNDNIPPNLVNSIAGTIDNFALSGGEANDWSVTLEGDIDPSNFTITDGKAKGGVGDGSLDGRFHGAADTLPVAATGEFNAGFNNGAVAGAFGMNKND